MLCEAIWVSDMCSVSPDSLDQRTFFPTSHTTGHVLGRVAVEGLFLSWLLGGFFRRLMLTRSNHICQDLGIFIPHPHSAVLVFYFRFVVHVFFSAGCLRCCVEVRGAGKASFGDKELTLGPRAVLRSCGQGLGCSSLRP